jgi:group I intron endonuclease
MSQAMVSDTTSVGCGKSKFAERFKSSGTVYIVTNLTNGKKYVGATTRGIAQRWAEHKSVARTKNFKTALHRAIKKYGPESFTIEVAGIATSWEALCALERQLIKEHNTVRKGYNSTAGGEGTIGYAQSESSKALQAEAREKRYADPIWKAGFDETMRRVTKNPVTVEKRRITSQRNDELRYASQDVADPDGAEARAKKRAVSRLARERRKERVANGLPELAVDARDVLDPDGAAKRAVTRAYNHASLARKAARGDCRIPRAERNALTMVANDVADPEGASRRNKDREYRSRRTEQKANPTKVFPDGRRTNREARDAADPAGAEKRARARASTERCVARKRGISVPVMKKEPQFKSAPQRPIQLDAQQSFLEALIK